MPAKVIQLCGLVPDGEDELRRDYDVCRWDEVADKQGWLAEHGPAVRAVVTAGHLGIDNELANRLPNLGLVAIAGVGYERVDRELAKTRGIRVTNTPNVLTEDVADLAVGLMIGAMRRLPQADAHVRGGHWTTTDMPLATKASGRRYGIFGLGQIGGAVARRLEGFGGSIAYTSTAVKPVVYRYIPRLVDLARETDVLILTAAVGPATRHAVNREVLEALGPQGFLVNVGRGALVDEPALVEALQARRIAGAGLDVFADEPNVPAELAALPNVVLAPHVGSATVDARQAMARLMLGNMKAFFAGTPLPTPVV